MDQASATVTITNLPSSIALSKSPEPNTVLEPGGPVQFNVRVDNTSTADAVEILTLVDTVHGNLQGQGDCSLPQDIPVGASYTCQFTADVIGIAGDEERNIVVALGVDDDGRPCLLYTSPSPRD